MAELDRLLDSPALLLDAAERLAAAVAGDPEAIVHLFEGDLPVDAAVAYAGAFRDWGREEAAWEVLGLALRAVVDCRERRARALDLAA